MTDALKMALNEICSYLQEGAIWHRRYANFMRKYAIRGWGRWHGEEGKGDAEILDCLEKLLEDQIDFIPMYMLDPITRALTVSMNSQNDFKQHHSVWLEREEKLISSLNQAITEMRTVDICLYEKLCCIQKEVQNEAMRVRMVYDRLDLAGWNGHDIGVCSMIIHKYFECEYQGGPIDFNVG